MNLLLYNKYMCFSFSHLYTSFIYEDQFTVQEEHNDVGVNQAGKV